MPHYYLLEINVNDCDDIVEAIGSFHLYSVYAERSFSCQVRKKSILKKSNMTPLNVELCKTIFEMFFSNKQIS
jgi:hypothetical protein